MDKSCNFLPKIFAVCATVFCITVSANSFADDTVIEITPSTWNDKKSAFCVGDFYASVTWNVCEEGYYVKGCGDYTIGTNWLKGVNDTFEKNGQTYKVTTNNYYDTKKTRNIENLKKFFSATNAGDITYFPNTGKQPRQDKSETWSTYKIDRDIILSTICNEKGFVCEKCPGNASVPASTVSKYNDKLHCESWKIHTIFDCYVTQMNDSSGQFYYKSDEQSEPAQCNYSVDSLNGTGWATHSIAPR